MSYVTLVRARRRSRLAAVKANDLRAALEAANKALRSWDGNNEGQRYADKFVWEAWDIIRAALK